MTPPEFGKEDGVADVHEKSALMTKEQTMGASGTVNINVLAEMKAIVRGPSVS